MSVYAQQSDFAKASVALLYAPDGSGGLAHYDPYWIDLNRNVAAVGVQSAGPAPLFIGYDGGGKPIAARTLTSGVPTSLNPSPVYTLLKAAYPPQDPGYPGVTGNPAYNPDYAYLKTLMIPTGDLAAQTGLPSPNTAYYRGRTVGAIRATGFSTDAGGKVGMFINGFDTPSEYDGDFVRPFGPNMHLYKNGTSPQVYAGVGTSQALHVRADLHLQTLYASPAAGVSVGAGAQGGWRGQFARADGAEMKTGVRYFAVLALMFDTRVVGNPGLTGEDDHATITQTELWCAGTLASGKTSLYVTNLAANSTFGMSTPRSASMHWAVTRQNMVNILAELGITGTTPEQLRLTGTTFSVELFDSRADGARTQFKPAQVGCHFSNQTVSIE